MDVWICGLMVYGIMMWWISRLRVWWNGVGLISKFVQWYQLDIKLMPWYQVGINVRCHVFYFVHIFVVALSCPYRCQCPYNIFVRVSVHVFRIMLYSISIRYTTDSENVGVAANISFPISLTNHSKLIDWTDNCISVQGKTFLVLVTTSFFLVMHVTKSGQYSQV